MLTTSSEFFTQGREKEKRNIKILISKTEIPSFYARTIKQEIEKEGIPVISLSNLKTEKIGSFLTLISEENKIENVIFDNYTQREIQQAFCQNTNEFTNLPITLVDTTSYLNVDIKTFDIQDIL